MPERLMVSEEPPPVSDVVLKAALYQRQIERSDGAVIHTRVPAARYGSRQRFLRLMESVLLSEQDE